MNYQGLWLTLLLSGFPVQAQLLPEKPPQRLLPPHLNEPLQRSTEHAQQRIQQQLMQQALAQQLSEKAQLPNPLTVLPAVLEVRTQTGQLLWREMEVENGFRAVEREWLLLLSIDEWQQLQARWPQLTHFVQKSRELKAIGLWLIQLKVPVELDSADAFQQQFNAELAHFIGRNHLYQPQKGGKVSDSQKEDLSEPSALIGSEPMCKEPVTLGMIDTAIASTHPGLTSAADHFQLQQQHFLPADIAPVYNHGTAVAGVLAARHPDITPLLPKLKLYNAAAFYASTSLQQSATLADLLQSLNWLVSQQVQVINMSLTGPDNPVLARAIARLSTQQIVLVAAVGNAGPAAPPLFPAAYPEVLAVTAVDSQLQLYRWANQGDHIDYAALGVQVPALTARGDISMQSGTSLATPVVSAAVACIRARQPDINLAHIRKLLKQQARDLGEPGKDSLFGYGLISPPLKTQLQ